MEQRFTTVPASYDMGSYAGSPSEWDRDSPSGDNENQQIRLGSLLSGRFADVNVDSVEEVRELRADR